MTTRTVSRRQFLRRATPLPAENIVLGNKCLAERGIYCRSCVDVCPTPALRALPVLNGGLRIIVDATDCTRCGDCLPICPASALSLASDSKAQRNG